MKLASSPSASELKHFWKWTFVHSSRLCFCLSNTTRYFFDNSQRSSVKKHNLEDILGSMRQFILRMSKGYRVKSFFVPLMSFLYVTTSWMLNVDELLVIQTQKPQNQTWKERKKRKIPVHCPNYQSNIFNILRWKSADKRNPESSQLTRYLISLAD